jgi:hypothetical protein
MRGRIAGLRVPGPDGLLGDAEALPRDNATFLSRLTPPRPLPTRRASFRYTPVSFSIQFPSRAGVISPLDGPLEWELLSLGLCIRWRHACNPCREQ